MLASRSPPDNGHSAHQNLHCEPQAAQLPDQVNADFPVTARPTMRELIS